MEFGALLISLGCALLITNALLRLFNVEEAMKEARIEINQLKREVVKLTRQMEEAEAARLHHLRSHGLGL